MIISVDKGNVDPTNKLLDEHEEDGEFWQTYVERLKRFAYTQRRINSNENAKIHRHKISLSIDIYEKLKNVATSMNISESFLYIGASALLLQSILNREYVSISISVDGMNLGQQIGTASNILPLLLHINEKCSIHEALLQIVQEIESMLKHVTCRIEGIRKLAKYSSNASFGPHVSVIRRANGNEIQDCNCLSRINNGGIIDINDLRITFTTDSLNGGLEILFEDIHDAHSREQLAALHDHLTFILDQLLCMSTIKVAQLAKAVEIVSLGKSFYGNRHRPIAAGCLQWRQSCDFLVRQVLSNAWMGTGASPFALSKVLIANRFVCIDNLDRVSNCACGKKPGTVLKIEENAWHVAAADGVVEISKFSDEFGQPISAQSVANQFQITDGVQLPIITPEQAQALKMEYAEAMFAVPHWSQHLEHFEPSILSIVQNSVSQSPKWATSAYQTPKDSSAIDVLVAWLIYIARDTQMHNIQIGLNATEYWYQENESSMQCICSKTIPFATSINLNDTFADAVANVDKNYKQMINHQPCLSDMLIRHNLNNGKISWPLRVSMIDTSEEEFSTNAGYERASQDNIMTLLINEQNGAFRWIYNSNRISEDEVNRISARLSVLLASARSDDSRDQPVAKLIMLPKIERDLLLYKWNKKTFFQSPTCCLQQLFEAQVERDGQANAVECNGEILSYSELNVQANRLAHHLIARGVKPDDRIALCVERSNALLVAILGILKAGGAYVPLDPVYSSQRLTHILNDSDPIFLLADATGRRALGKHQVPTIDLDKLFLDNSPIGNPDAPKIGIITTHLAYIIYTSGSTGTPKGVMVEHQQVVRLIDVTKDKFDFGKEDKWCLFHSFSFDVSVWEIWGAFSNGSQLSIVPYDTIRSSNELYDWICSNGITVLNQTPSAFKMLMQAENIHSQSNQLRYVNFAGEAFDPMIWSHWNEKCGERQTVLVNMYGTTETTVHATYQRMESLEDAYSVGRPFPDLYAYLLDSYDEPVPLGAEGELYIAGAGVTRGYFNRLDLTAERFLPNPFNDEPSARMYCTGDRARYLPDSNLVYLGRGDQQVKIRGFRVELGEIEAHLVEFPQVREAIVQSYGNGSDIRLVAYVVTDTNTLIAQDLRTYLSNLLPEYMIPAAYVSLPSLPLTPNGKLDRRALPTPDDEAFAHQEYDAPQSEMENKLANIWREMLNIKRISRNDNFFALGGHSLLVVRLMAELRQIGLDTTVREVFDSPNLGTLAAALTRYQAVEIPPNLITADSTEITPEMLPLISLCQAEIDAIVAQVPGGVTNIQDIYGLAPLQSGILFHHMKTEHGDPYLLRTGMCFTDRSVLKRYADALHRVTVRHDILRTVFMWDGLNEPAQVVLRQVPSLLTEIIFDESNEPVLEQLSHQFNPQRYRFNLTQAPLLRLMASPTFDGSWMAYQMIHHIISDHLTNEKLVTEVHAIIDGKIEELPSPTSFRYIVVKARLTANRKEHKRFFTEMLGDIVEPTLPFGLSDVALDGTEINETRMLLPQTLSVSLREHARRLLVSLASICHLAWAQLLARASGREAVVFGTVLLGRLQIGESNSNIMGPVINTLPIRIDIDERSVATAVRDSHARLSALLADEHAPLVLAQRCSGVPAGSPLFSALLNYVHDQSGEQATVSISGVTFYGEEERTNYPLILSVLDDGDSLRLLPQVLSPLSATRICSYMQQSLESLANALEHVPQQQVRKLEVIPFEERTLLLYTWNQITATFPPVRCLQQLFEAQVERDGQANAVECNGEILSYSELNVQANRLAHHLIARGVKPDDRIALCVERSNKLLVAILGILKAGGAYVPLDPVYSSQRLTHILNDSDPILLLADATGRRALGKHQVPMIDLDKTLPDNLPIDNPKIINVGALNLAYVIYTSGSTGTPKGVMVEHQQVVRLINVTKDKFDFGKEDKWCLFHSFSFDVSVWEIWGAFSNGSQLSIVPYDTIRSSNELYDWICSNGITVLNQTPSAFKMLMQAENINSQSNQLRYVNFAGEAFDPMIWSHWNEKCGERKTVLVNMYGTTETTVHATYQRMESLEDAYSVGRPFPDLCAYLLDSYDEPVPLGAEGELYIAGAGVTRGYFNRLDLTAERFLPNPFNDEPSARMYRTGDLARYLPDSNLVYLGRGDQQVKIRGFRVELGEIEAHLVEFPQVREAIVQNYGNGSDTRLVAYVVTDTNTLIAQDLRTYLSNLLPEYMIPAVYVRLSSLPLTPNGKLDRRALPTPNDEAFAHVEYEAPQDEMEKNLADVWCKVLGIERVSRHDNFFALGGHSLLVVRLIAHLQQIGLDTNVREVFNASSLSTLASAINRYQATDIPPNLIVADSTEITPEMLPLISLSQAEIDAIVVQVPGGVTNIQDIYGLAPLQSGMLFHHIKIKLGDTYLLKTSMCFTDRAALEHYTDAMQRVIERHDILRTVFMWDGLNEPAQIVLRQVPSLLTEIVLDESNEPVLERLNKQFNPRHYRLDLTQAPLLRLMTSPTSDGDWMAVQLMHHMNIDHSTLEQMMTEVKVIIDGKIDELKTPISFRNLVANARLSASSDEHKRFFTKMLGDVDEPTLPFGLSDVDLDGNDINEIALMLPQTLNDQLREHARKLRVSLASLCHLAWAQVLARASGRETVVFGTVLLGRLQTGDTNNDIMGPMINTLPIRIDIDERSVEIAVRDTHAQLSALLPNELAPLVLAQRCSGVSAGLPLFSAILNYRHNQKGDQIAVTLPGITVLDDEERTNYPIVMSIEDDSESVGLTPQIVSTFSTARICGYMQQALESLADAIELMPQQQIRTLSVIPPEECTLLLHTWNQITTTSTPARCLHQLFEAQIEKNGQSNAVECNEKILSYSELNVQANRLAHYLIAQGVKAGDHIAICIERSVTLITSILAILKAGGAYVPLDPVYSSQRLTHILKDAKPMFVLVDATGRKALGEHQVPVIDLEKPLSHDLPIENPDARKVGVAPTHLAYLIYTSGSTGTPKGVMVEHHQAVKLLESVHNKFEINTQDKWCLFHSFSFDFSIWEIWGALCYGSQLSICSYDVSRSTNEFYDWLCNRRITVLSQTPPVLGMLMQAMSSSFNSNRLRYIFFGGEASDPFIVKNWHGDCVKNRTLLVHMYGPTEAVVFATYWIIEDAILMESLIPIGRPFSNKKIYLLDSYGEPVPLGAEGEMYIGGAGVACGYLNRPDLTEERFLPDPFNDNPTARMYRTGDLARYMPDGNLVYVGRTDQQVKIRGFRIELGEIETRLVEHPLVREAVVQPLGNGTDTRLVAYVVADSDSSIAQNLRSYLSNLLPDYMLPAAYVMLPSLPLTHNGKLDRRALPTPDGEAFAHQQYEAPQNEMEEKLADIWRELLGIERISRHDNFFALGGHSLLVVRLMAKLRQIGLDTSVREVFGAPGLATLAAALTRYQVVDIPPNVITTDSTEITPEMLPLISLSQAEINAIIAQVPCGVGNIQDIYGLAPLQTGMLYHHMKAERGDPYLITTHMHFIDRASLESYAKALQQVVVRHDIFRTIFVWDGLSESAQIVLRRVPSLLTELILDDTDQPVLEQLSDQFNPRHYRLDLTQAPLLRLIASPTSERNWVGVQLMHHITGDTLTMEKLMTEVHEIIDGKFDELATPTPFRYLVAQTRLGTSDEEHKRFFSKMLGDIDEPTLAFGLSDVDLDGKMVNDENMNLPQILNDQLRQLARNLHISLASMCHLAWAQVLARASGREAVVFGTVLLGRLQTGGNNVDIMGPTINTLPFRMDIDVTSVDAAVCQAHARLSALLAHEHAQLVLAQRCSGVSSGLPLFSAILNYRHNQKGEQSVVTLPGVTFNDGEERTNYPLSMSLDDNDVSLSLSVQIESPVSTSRICGYMQQALESLVDALLHMPQQRIRTLEVIPPAERTLLLHTCHQNTIDSNPVRCLQQLFEAQVERDGHSIAVECDGDVLSYSELNAQVNRLAHHLIARGVKPEDRIALCVERSIKMIVAMLAILKAGGAYVPLDSVYSSQRLTHILNDCDPTLLLVDATGRTVLGDHQVPLIDLDKPLPGDFSTKNPDTIDNGVTPNHLAYIIYTSGSTGTPKGVMVEHAHVVQHIMAVHDLFDFNKNDKWCLFHSFSFDVSVWEMWGALYCGGQMSIVPQNVIHNTDEFCNWISSSGITVVNQTPSALKNLLLAKNFGKSFDRLRYVFVGGEALDPLIVTEWNEKRHNKRQTRLVNMYGPTEITIDATIWTCDNVTTEDLLLPIGRPIPNRRAYLLDVHGELVPFGAEGELYIGGNSVARGYLNCPELTEQHFLPDSFSCDPTARMYRTGDRARYLPDGNLVYLGRTDQQVKIRGFRIELGEIEAHLITYSQVNGAIVQLHGNGSDARLVAYVVADSDPLIAQNLRSYLSNLLPDYMVPSAYVCLSSLPLTPNGKLDRRALPAPDDEDLARQEYKAPQSEMEKRLADIWCELLGIERISRNDNFFALGGHSLLVVRLMAELRQMGLDTTVQKIFDASSLATLAASLTRYQALTIPPNLITTDSTTITPEMLPLISLSQTEIDALIEQVPGGISNIQDIYGLAPLQTGMLFHHIKSDGMDPYIVVVRMHFINWSTLKCYANALQQVVERHDILRTIFIWEDLNEPAQVVLRRVPSLLTEVALDDTDEPALEQLNKQFNLRHYCLPLTQAPLMRLIASPTSDGSWVALQLMHHIISDHSTDDIVDAEVHAINEGKIGELPTPAPFRYLIAQAQQGLTPDEYKRFFTEMLGDIDEPTLPFGLSDVSLDGTRINEAHMELPQTLNDQLREHARKLQISLASICHLAWALVLARASGRESVVFGTVLLESLPTVDKNSNIMGLMINALPIRIDVVARGVESAVRDTHARLSALLAHEHAPLVLAQRCSGCPVGTPLFNSMLNYRHNQKSEQVTASLPGVTVLYSEEHTNYPLLLSIEDNDDSLGLTPQIISPMTAVRIGAYMQQALESLANALVHAPQQELRTLELIPPEERLLLLHTWNETKVTFPPARCLHQLFEAQVERDGQAIAVECNGEVLSYSELNAQANRVAHYLIARGSKPDDRIALCVERSTKLIVTILGILKSGSAYVPLDPKYPSKRLTNILQDSNPLCVLADSTGRAALGDHQVPIVDMEQTFPIDLPIDNPSIAKLGLTPGHLAYIIYTSGSTGTPKGVMMEHGNATNCIYWIHDAFTIEHFQHTSFSTSVNFDMSLYECFAALSMGTTLHVVSNALTLSKSSNIFILSTVPSAMTTILNADSIPTSLRTIHLIGEPLKANLIKRIFSETQINELYNLYGQTETSFLITRHRYNCGDEVIEMIGRPIANTRLYLLDVHGEPVPLGAVGEMYFSGAGVGRGYLNRPEDTAERFLPDLFSDNPTARMYRTGDLARYLPDGNLIYLGRNDQQVKIRGFRIELGEIEARLVEYPLVRDAVVQPHGNGSDVRLVAYIVGDADTLEAQDLRIYLSDLLPDYMVPAAYVYLSSLPLTPNGKLDRRALPAPDDEAFAHQQYEAPQNEMEEKLADIWRELLRIERISRYDSFFELGGHSLLVMQFVNKAKLSDIHITTRGVFSYPTLKDLAEQLTKRDNRMYCDVAISIRKYGNAKPLFLLPDGTGDTSYAFELTRDIDKNIPVYVLPWSSPDKKQPSSIEEMADAMIVRMRRIQSNGPYAIAGYSGGGVLAYEMVKQLTDSGNDVSFLGLIDSYSPIINSLNEIEVLLFGLTTQFPVFKTINDSEWWDRISKRTVDEVIEEIKKLNIDLKGIDIEWEALLLKQRYNYQKICASIKINPLPINTHFFKAADREKSSPFFEHLDNINRKLSYNFEKLFECPKLGWENYNISTKFDVIAVDGDHQTMITDPKNRSLLGGKITQLLISTESLIEK